MSIKLLNKQWEETWAELSKRFIENNIRYDHILSYELYSFLNAKSKSIRTNIGYLLMPILVTISYLLGKQKSKLILNENFKLSFNLYGIFAGPPSTGMENLYTVLTYTHFLFYKLSKLNYQIL